MGSSDAARLDSHELPELAAVLWRPRVGTSSLRRSGRLWTLSTVAHTVPFIVVAVLLPVLNPITAPVALVALAQAWIIPELYAARGANVLRRRRNDPSEAERVALGLLGDLIGHSGLDLHGRSGVVLEPGGFGVWLIGEAGAVLVAPRGRRVFCYCVRTTEPSLPRADRIAHLLLALRADEAGFATVANLAFSGARWRLARRLGAPARAALDVAGAAARNSGRSAGQRP